MSNRFADVLAGFAAWIASRLGPRAMRVIAKLNKRVTNPVQRLWAPRLPYMAVSEHTGRNVQAAGSAGVVHRGKHYRLTDPRVIPVDSLELPSGVRAIGTSARSALHGTLTLR